MTFLKKNPFINPNKINFNIMEVNITNDNSKATVTVSVNGEEKEIKLINHSGKWYLTLKSLFVQKDAVENSKPKKKKIVKEEDKTSKKEDKDTSS